MLCEETGIRSAPVFLPSVQTTLALRKKSGAPSAAAHFDETEISPAPALGCRSGLSRKQLAEWRRA